MKIWTGKMKRLSQQRLKSIAIHIPAGVLWPEATGQQAGFWKAAVLSCSTGPEKHGFPVSLSPPLIPHYLLGTSTLVFRKLESPEIRSDENCFFGCITDTTKEDNYTHGGSTPFNGCINLYQIKIAMWP